jgi:hypothetical protein
MAMPRFGHRKEPEMKSSRKTSTELSAGNCPMNRNAVNLSFAVALAALMGIAVPGSKLSAAEYTLVPDFRIAGHYDDNPRLRETDDADEIKGGFVELGALARWRTPTSLVLLRPRLHSSHYPDNANEESNDTYLDFAARNEGQRSQWSLVAGFAREQVIRGDRTNVDFEDPEFEDPEMDEESGRIDARRRRTQWRVAPRFAYVVSERTDVGMGLHYSDVQYSPQAPGEALDYTTARADAFFIRKLTERSRFRTTVFATSYEADEINNDSTGYGLRLRYERDVTEIYDTYVDVGAQRTDVEAGANDEIDDSSTGFLLDAGVRRKGERTELRLAGGRAIQPSGTGFLRETDQIRLNLRHQFRPRWYGELAGIVQRTDAVDSVIDFSERDYFELRGRLGYHLTQAWIVEASYAFRHQDYEDTPGSAEANVAYLSLNYQPRGRAWSR